MPYSLEGRTLHPLSDIFTAQNFPLAEFVADPGGLLASLKYTEATKYFDGANLVVDLWLVADGSLAVSVPGLDFFDVSIGSGTAPQAFYARAVIGPGFSLEFVGVPVAVTISDSVLEAEGGGPVSVVVTCDLRLSRDGFHVTRAPRFSLPKAYVAGTDISIQAEDVALLFGSAEQSTDDGASFQGVSFALFQATLPAEITHTATSGQAPLTVTIDTGVIDASGFSGLLSLDKASDAVIEGQALGFSYKLNKLVLDIRNNQPVQLSLAAAIHVPAFDDRDAQGQPRQKWLDVDIGFGVGGNFALALSATQTPPPAGEEPDSSIGALVTLKFEGVVRFHCTGLRVEKVAGGEWYLYLSGACQFLFGGATQWPRVRFEQIGVSSSGKLILPEGGGIVFDAPLVVKWEIAELTIAKLRLGTAPPTNGAPVDPNKLQLALAAEVTLVKGLPAGASVKGLTVTWDRTTSAPPAVAIEGIGIRFGVPGSFLAWFEASSSSAGGAVEFRGQGGIELTPLQMGLEIGVVVGKQSQTAEYPEAFNYLYLFADAKLLPSGIPIAQTGIAIYGFQGLFANNMRLDINTALPEPDRYDEVFFRSPQIGLTHQSKWKKAKGQHAIGAGIVLGTADTGFSLNVKGLFLVAFPDLTLFLQARANFVKIKPDVTTNETGTLDALLVYAMGSQSINLALKGSYDVPKVVSVSVPAQAYFSFNDPAAWFAKMGEDIDGKRASAKLIEWGGNWLINGGFWFRIDNVGVKTGAQFGMDLSAEVAPFYFDVHVGARADAELTWRPQQMEGGLTLSGYFETGIRGVAAIRCDISGTASAYAANPLYLRFDVQASFSLGVGSLKVVYNPKASFEWQYETPPELPPALTRVVAKPRNWTPLDTSGGGSELDTGTVVLLDRPEGDAPPPSTNPPVVPPHSVIHLLFGKSVADLSGNNFNERVNLDGGGWFWIGKRSKYAALHELKAAAVYELSTDLQTRTAISFFGTWAKQTPQPHRQLAIGSSERFHHDGSTTQAFVEPMDLDYCAGASTPSNCTDLEDLDAGYSVLPDGSLVYYEPGVVLKVISASGGRPHVVLDVNGDTQNRMLDENPDDERTWIILLDHLQANELPVEICIPALAAADVWDTTTRRGGSLTNKEEWTVPAEQHIFVPGKAYELEVRLAKSLKWGDEDPTVVEETVKIRWRAGDPPSHVAELTNYVADVYPRNAMRPVYTGYDLSATFVAEYVPYLWEAAQKELMFRLFDGQGRPVTGPGGSPLLLPVTSLATGQRSKTQQHYADQYALNVTQGCIAPGGLVGTPQLPVLTLAGFQLTKNSQYRAEIVSDDDVNVALYSWTFTTSSFTTFSELATVGRGFSRRRRSLVLPAATDDFDTAARALSIPTVGYVAALTLTPLLEIHTGQPDTLRGVLLESPEPLGFDGRCTVSLTVGGTTYASTIKANGDGTRAFAWFTGVPNSATSGSVTLTWKRYVPPPSPPPPVTLPRLRLAGSDADEVVTFAMDWGS